MTRLVRGFRGKLDDLLDAGRPFEVKMQTNGRAVYDTCCFGVDSADKLSDDRYMVFYNQPASPGNAVCMRQSGKDFIYMVDLPQLPASVVKLIFTVSIDGLGTMGEVSSHNVTISQNGRVCAELCLSGSDFHRERAIIDIEIYNKNGWRCSAVAMGFNGGLAELLKKYGGELAAPTTPPPAPRPSSPRATSPRNTAQRPQRPQQAPSRDNSPRPVKPRNTAPQYNSPRQTPPPQPQPAPQVITAQYNAQPQYGPQRQTPPPPPQPTPQVITAQYNAQPQPAPQRGRPLFETTRPPTYSAPPYSAPRSSSPQIVTSHNSIPQPSPQYGSSPYGSQPQNTPQYGTPQYDRRPVNTLPTGEYNTPICNVQQATSPYTNVRNEPPQQTAQPYRPPQVGANGAVDDRQLADKLMKKINLTKDKVKLEKHVVNLSKCVVDLSKKSGVDLGNTRAKVVVALDYSGSMCDLYRNGTVQDTINRLVPLGLTFDDNGSIDMFLFQSDFRKMPDINLSNYENYVSQSIFGSGYYMGGTNYYPVLSCIIKGCTISRGLFRGSEYIPPIVDGGDPTFILFITDGENADQSATDRIIRESSTMNVFIQFIGIGNQTFRYLEQLDDMAGRQRDNTGFSKMADLAAADDNKLYTNVLEQFSKWLKGLQ